MSSKELTDFSDGSGIEKSRGRRTIKVEKLPSNPNESSIFPDVKVMKSVTDSVKATRAFYQEEDEAIHRDASFDLGLHKAVCVELRTVLNRVKDLKKDGSEITSAEVEELKVHGLLQFVSLKKLNRVAHFRSKKVRDSTNEAKLKVDQHHLKLHNLLYELAHLEKEIHKCLQFKSKDEEVSLVPVEQFYKEAPAEISKHNITYADPHQLRLARLHWELEQRKRLSTEVKEAAGLKNHIMSEIKTKKEFLDSLQPKLNAVLQSTKPVQDHLGMHFDEVREQHRTASYLPSPLYVLYVQATAYSEACDKNLVVSINGDVELARTMEQVPIIVDNDIDDEVVEQESSAEVRSRRNTSTCQQDKARNLLFKHPLSVCLCISCADQCQLSITFYYIMSLSIVTVCVKLSVPDTTSCISAGDLLLPDTLLNCLYTDDDGTLTPNPANTYLTVLGEFSKYADEVGHPYRWAQWLCGLQFLTNDPQKAQVSVSACHMADVVHRLRQRIQDRVSLQKLLTALEQCQIPVTSECISLYPAKISSKLIQWRRTTYQDFSTCNYTQRFIKLGLVRPDSMFFTASIQRGNAVLTAQVVIGADYPRTASLLALSLQCHTSLPRTALNDDAIRDMEAELNICDAEKLPDCDGCRYLLTNQLQRLLVCLDVYLEIQSVMSSSSEFSQDRICSRRTRGRNHARPYTYNSQLCFFTQR